MRQSEAQAQAESEVECLFCAPAEDEDRRLPCIIAVLVSDTVLFLLLAGVVPEENLLLLLLFHHHHRLHHRRLFLRDRRIRDFGPRNVQRLYQWNKSLLLPW